MLITCNFIIDLTISMQQRSSSVTCYASREQLCIIYAYLSIIPESDKPLIEKRFYNIMNKKNLEPAIPEEVLKYLKK